ncbi:PasA protein [Ectopseudomonas mendocina]|uniref:PasA protein n=2 Tax=Ectopseudomonas mendocina TaxID=300 RepID=A0A379IXE7_ECTME|nr:MULTISPECIES: DUF6586 family protein [Pseudomonas]ALN19997.1 PasA protein [Pseudomonas mendocina S5.2]KER99108.1 PasA protein [Pseudomonas mendocina]MDF2073078.1 PasA protein [Pseudomonas mendocina]QTN48508.1 PasA protein [Pseudomonas mendocina]TRO17546.1 PasA protein [Pseudomonas mendocina]
MAKEIYTRTNQKIFFAGIALDNWRKAEASSAFNVQALVQAEREAALFHLYGGLLGVCHEIAGYYRMNDAAPSRVEAFVQQAVLEGSPSPELAELVELAQQRETWLAQLLAAYAELFQPPREERKAKVDPSMPLITAVSVGEEPVEVSLDDIEAWRQQLKALILRFREGLSEC